MSSKDSKIGAILRRSRRIFEKFSLLSPEDNKLGYLSLLPLELKCSIFSHLSVQDLGILALSSKEMQTIMWQYVDTPMGIKHLQNELNYDPYDYSNDSLARQHKNFEILGLFLRHLTHCYRVQLKLQGVTFLIKKLNFTLKGQFVDKYLYCFGILAKTFLNGWDEKSCIMASAYLMEQSHMDKTVAKVLSFQPGTYVSEETEIREFFRNIYLDPYQDSKKSFWLKKILMPFPYIYQAKLLYILYGPYMAGRVIWYFNDRQVISDHAIAYKMFNELSACIHLLSKKCFNSIEVLAVLKELSTIPRPWSNEQLACFLIFCGTDISALYFESLLACGRLTSVMTIIIEFIELFYRFGYNMNGILQIIQKLACQNHLDVARMLCLLPASIFESGAGMLEENGEQYFLDYIEGQKDFFAAVMLKAFNMKREAHPFFYRI